MTYASVPRPYRWGIGLCLAGLLACSAPPGPAPAADAVPQRIVSLAPGLTEILFALGAGERVVGVTEYCDYPAAARAKTRVGGYANPSVEAILALRPDLVVASPNVGNRDPVLALQDAGVVVLVVRADGVEDTYRAIEALARACGVAARGRDLARHLRERIAAVASRAATRERVPVLFAVQAEPVIAAGPDTLPGQLLTIAGGDNVVRQNGYPRLGIEAVIRLAPDVILQTRMDAPTETSTGPLVELWQRWTSIPAVRAGRVAVIDGTPALRPGPRIADAAEELFGRLHGEAPEHGGRRE